MAKDVIHVDVIHAGSTRTHRHELPVGRLVADRGITREEVEQHSAGAVSLGRFFGPKDIAELTVFLASEQAGTITDQTVAVDGGAVEDVFY